METKIYDKHGINIRQITGSNGRGKCYQVTLQNEYVTLDESEFVDFVKNLQDHKDGFPPWKELTDAVPYDIPIKERRQRINKIIHDHESTELH